MLSQISLLLLVLISSNIAFGSEELKLSLKFDPPCFKSEEACLPPSKQELETRVQNYYKWQKSKNQILNNVEEHVHKLSERAASYDELISKSSGEDVIANLKEVQTDLYERVATINQELPQDRERINRETYITGIRALMTMNTSLTLEKIRNTSKKVFNLYKSLNEEIDNISYYIDGRYLRESYLYTLNSNMILVSQRQECGLGWYSTDPSFVTWLLGKHDKQSLKIDCQQVYDTRWWRREKNICNKYDPNTHKLTLYFKKEGHSTTTYGFCERGAMAWPDRYESRIGRFLKNTQKLYPKILEVGRGKAQD